MARDTELDRLKREQDLAYNRKQDAYGAMKRAEDHRSAARNALDCAYAAKQNAYDAQDAAWQNLQRLRDYNGPRIDSLNSQQETAYQNMRDAFDRASAAHDARDGANARLYADEGHSYKQKSQDCVAERRRLVQEVRDARDRHEGTRPAFQYAKAQFDDAKQTHDSARDDHQRKQAEFRHAKEAFDQAVRAFKARLEKVRAESQRRRQDKRSIAERAGVPAQYLDNVRVSTEHGGTANLYFGGVGKPDGPGHGHYVMDRNGTVTYRRDPFDPHGRENFTEDGWSARAVGTVEDREVTFRVGMGDNAGHTLIADGTPSGRAFDRRGEHNHYGDKREGNGRVEDEGGDRGYYTGPNH